MLLKKGLWSLMIPAVLSCVGVLSKSVWLIVMAFFMHFVVLKLAPVCRGRENVWMFIMVIISSVPINVYLLVFMGVNNMLFDSIFVLGLFRCVLYYAMLFSVEELILGLVTRVLWKKQHKIKLK